MAQSTVAVADVKCEYLADPIGMDTPHPRFTWRLQDDRQGAKQTAYRIVVGKTVAELAKGTAWNTGWVKSDAQLATYAGAALKPFTKYFFRVDVADKGGVKKTGKVSTFEIGMMTMDNWKGEWITDINDVALKPAPYFRKVFSAAKKIKSARAYITAGGLFELYVNGQKIGNHRMDPMYTRFDKRNLYITHDVTANLLAGKNAVGVLLGNGWYNHQSTAVWDFHNAKWRARPTFLLDLRVTYTDGSTETISSGQDWKTALSPVIFNSIYTAEHYDARLEQPGWNTIKFDDSAWKTAISRQSPSKNIVAQVMHPVRNVEEIATKSVKAFSDSNYVFDLGRNISGVSKFTVDGPAGTIIRLKHGERVYANGHVDMSNIDVHYRPKDKSDPFQTDIIILDGKGPKSFSPHFNYKGFQYVEVNSSAPLKLTHYNMVGYFMHSDVPAVGKVSSSNPTVDKMWYATNNSYLSNLFGYPTDCPQREKNGWTGDATIANETGLYGFDGITVYEKWMADHRDEQKPDGVLPSIIPTDGWGYDWGNGPDWTSTIAMIPWNIYLFYGDKHLLAECYDNIKLYVDHIDEKYPTGLTTWGLGDWVPVKSKSPVELTSTCYYYKDALILSSAAKLLGKTADAEKYAALAEKIKTAFNQKYLKADGIYNNGLQTELSCPLYWGLVPDDMKAKVAGNLAKRVEADNFHLDVGLLGQKAILNALSDNGYADVAYKVAAQETYPSWGWWIKNGATTLYENWKIDAKNDISLNHIMFGEIGAWLYKGLGGIYPDADQPGFKNVILAPNFVNGLDRFETSHKGPYGTILSSWKKEYGKVIYNVEIPANSTATVKLPTMPGMKAYIGVNEVKGTTTQLAAGKYRFELR
ncbi:glycoside hydrolase family 78 protein [Mucilaginibacter myungsuensis]